MKENKLITLILIMFFATESLAYIEDRSHEHLKLEAARELERLHEIWVTTPLISKFDKDLIFTSSNIVVDKEQDTIKFINPRLANRPLRPAYHICNKTETNWFGFEVCKGYQEVANARHLCRQLGYGSTTSTHVKRVNNNSYLSVWSLNENDSNKWHSIRAASMLGGSYQMEIISDFTCRLD